MPSLQKSTDRIIEDFPQRSESIIASMNTMPSVDAQKNDPQRVFAYLNSAMEYTVNFFKNSDSDPSRFAPPSPPNSVKLSKEDLNNFTARATNFIADNWDAISSHAHLTGDGKAKVANRAEMDFTRHQVGRKEVLKSELGKQKSFSQHKKGEKKGALLAGAFNGGRPAPTKDQKQFALETTKGAAIGFLKGGKAGAVKGAITKGGKKMMQQVRDKRSEAESHESQKTNNAPQMK